MVRNAFEDADETRPKHEEFARTVIAGHPQGAVRRIILYVLIGGLIVAGMADIGTLAGVVMGSIAIMLLFLLAMTDQLA